MANTWAGMTFVNIATKAFNVFKQRVIPLYAFTTDFSADVASQGTQVTTRIVPASSAAQDLQNSYTGNRAAAAADTTTEAVTVTLNQQPIVGFNMTDEEAGQIGAGVWQDTRQNLITNKINMLADFVLDYVFRLIINANFSNVAFTGAASTYDIDDVVDIGTTLSTANWPMGTLPVYMVLQSAYFDALKKDNAVQDLSASGIPVQMQGDAALRKLDDFILIKAPTLPPAGTPTSEHLTGFVARPEAIAIAMRPVESQAADKLMWYQTLVDPDSGLSLVYRAWYDAGYGKVYHTFETLFGAAKAYTTALQRIRSA